VVTSLPVTTITSYSGESNLEVYGTVGYDPRQVGSISSNVSGRIEKLYVRYRYQPVNKGQALMDVYSPELSTAQQELLFLLKSDPTNLTLIDAAKQKLGFLGMSASQVNTVIRNHKPIASVTIYSRYSGHIHDAGGELMQSPTAMKDANEPAELSIREGSYVEKGKAVFTILDHHNVWALFQLRPSEGTAVKVGDRITITGETEGNHQLVSTIRFIDPFYQSGEKLLTIRASLEGHQHLPAGTPLKGVIKENISQVKTLPRQSVISLGVRTIVYIRKAGLVRPVEVITGKRLGEQVEIVSGLSQTDSVIVNGQYLADNETLIRLKQ
jgi:Cu(I)/Ag(I) efflux system membrane fusion protein